MKGGWEREREKRERERERERDRELWLRTRKEMVVKKIKLKKRAKKSGSNPMKKFDYQLCRTDTHRWKLSNYYSLASNLFGTFNQGRCITIQLRT